MVQKSILFILLLLSFSLSSAQLERSNFWPFTGKGIDFSSGTAVVVPAYGYIIEASSAISDTAGVLQFYTDGVEVRNVDNSLMPNGTGLHGCYSSAQGALVVPMPRNPDLYYIFAASCHEDGYAYGATYSIVDMRLDNGRGDVTVKNQTIKLNVSEEISGTYHENECDFWIVLHDLNSDSYFSYLLTGAGLDSVPVVSHVGPDYSAVQSGFRGRSRLKFNQSGTLAVQTARENTNTQVHHFDRLSGQLSTYFYIGASSYSDFYSACFSPNDSVLYVIAFKVINNTSVSYLLQFDLSTPTFVAVSSSKQVLLTEYVPSLLYQLQLGPDGKIYFSRSAQDYLGTISNPNVLGTGANVNAQALYVGSVAVRGGLPNFVSQFIGPGPNLICPPPVSIEVEDHENTAHVYPNPSNGPVHFEFTQNAGENYRLQITDLLGRQILLEDQIQSPYLFESEKLATGIYVYSLFEGLKVISQGKLSLE